MMLLKSCSVFLLLPLSSKAALVSSSLGPSLSIGSFFSPTPLASTGRSNDAGDVSTLSSLVLSSTNTIRNTTLSVPVSTDDSFRSHSTASRTGPGGISVQPSPNPAVTHLFSPFPSPTQNPVPGIYPETDPLSPPEVGSDVIPDFNPAWSTAWEKARKLIQGLSIEQKVNFSTGVGWQNGRCLVNSPPVPIDGSGTWKGLCLEDSPLGVRATDRVTTFPAGVNAAATWQRKLMRQRGEAIGAEFKGKGVNVALGPMMNLGRIPQGGRNWEGFGIDPFLSGEAAYETVLGMQSSGIQAQAKHFVNNEQEFDRMTESSNVDDRAQHELYTAPFLRSVMAGVASIMCSYNQINETFGCENDRTLNQILKGEFGFRGFVSTDWGAHHSTLSAAFGLDLSMPGDITFGSGTTYFGPNLTAYVQNGSISEARLDDMATRVAAGWYYLHQDSPDYPSPNFDAVHLLSQETNEHVDVQGDHKNIVRAVDTASTVLLKNKNGTLPLATPRQIAVFGSDAGPQPGGPNEYLTTLGNAGILAVGSGSGTATFSYLISPLEALQARARDNHTTIDWLLDDFDLDAAQSMALAPEVAFVFINSVSGESNDRQNLSAWHGGDALVSAVAGQNKNTVIVVHSVGPIIMEEWVEHENVTAIVWAGLGGTETGNALVDVLYGAVNPSGRLPYTIAKSVDDYPAQPVGNENNETIIQIPYMEGLFVDYRHFDAQNITPRFEFGFGMSYTTFEYSNITISEVPTKEQFASLSVIDKWKSGIANAGGSGEGSSVAVWLHEPAYRVTFTIKNTGSVSGTEIPQLYISQPPSANSPPSMLKGFSDIYLAPGESGQVSITLSRHSLSIWDVVSQGWARPIGEITVNIGASSRDFRLKA